MKRLDIKKICGLALPLVLFGLMQLLIALSVRSIERSLPHAAALDKADGVGITVKQAMSAYDSSGDGEHPDIIIGAMSLAKLETVSAGGIGASASVYSAYATPAAGICLPFRYTYGNWFLPDETNMASFAVIPESLPVSLFGTAKPEGNALTVGGTEFRICGVYSEYGVFADQKGFLQKISGDGIPRVYLYNPLRMAELPVSVLYLSDGNQSEDQLLKQKAINLYVAIVDGKTIDYRQQIQLAHSLWYLSLLLCMFFIVILLISFAGGQFLRLHAGKNEPISKRLKRVLIGVCITVGALALLILLLNQLHIPPRYLPQDNIFDFSSYIKSVESFFISLHTAGWDSHFEWIFVTQLLALLFWSLCGIAFFVAGALKLRSFIVLSCRKSIGVLDI